jgi:hypothetical protein
MTTRNRAPQPIRYTGRIMYRERSAIVDLVHAAARESGVRPSQFIRSAVLMGLTLAGHDVARIADKPARAGK